MIDPIADDDSSVPDSLRESGIQSPVAGPSSAPDHPLLLLRDLPDTITSGIRSRSRSPLVRYSCSTSDEDQQPDQPDLPGRPRSRSRSPLNRSGSIGVSIVSKCNTVNILHVGEMICYNIYHSMCYNVSNIMFILILGWSAYATYSEFHANL